MALRNIKIKGKNKKAVFDMPFSWLFAIIVGSVILFLAIFAASRFIDVAKIQRSGEVAKSLTILIDPAETGIASAVGDVIHLGEETRIEIKCREPDSVLAFGKQTIAVTESSRFKEEWAQVGPAVSIYNKFIFSNQIEQGEDLYLFSKPAYIGYKIGDITIVSAEDYCFVAPPNFIREELEGLSLKNINISNNLELCKKEDIKVCFGIYSDECNISIQGNEDYSAGTINKQGKDINYVGNLIYAGIFSDPDSYECNLKRIVSKTAELAKVYKEKIEIVKIKDCNSIIGLYLDSIISKADNYKTSFQISEIYDIATSMDSENEKAECKIYPGEDY